MKYNKSTMNFLETLFPDTIIRVYSVDIKNPEINIMDLVNKFTKSYIKISVSENLIYLVGIFENDEDESAFRGNLNRHNFKYTANTYSFRIKTHLNNIMSDSNSEYNLIY